MTFDHQAHGLNLITRLNWEARIAAAESRPLADAASVQEQVNDLAEYVLFVGEATLAFEVTPRAGFAEALAARAPVDRRGRSCAQMDLTRRLLKVLVQLPAVLRGLHRPPDRSPSSGVPSRVRYPGQPCVGDRIPPLRSRSTRDRRDPA